MPDKDSTYVVVASDDSLEFLEAEVESLIEEGFVPCGGISIIPILHRTWTVGR